LSAKLEGEIGGKHLKVREDVLGFLIHSPVGELRDSGISEMRRKKAKAYSRSIPSVRLTLCGNIPSRVSGKNPWEKEETTDGGYDVDRNHPGREDFIV